MLRDIRAEAQDMLRSLAEIRQKSALADAQSRAQEMITAATAAAEVLARDRVEIEDRLNRIRLLFQDDATQYDWCGDQVTNVENYWRRAVSAWPNAAASPETIGPAAARAEECLDQVVYYCASLTITQRLDNLLDNMRIGQPLDFHHAFEDELPKREARDRVLEDLARQPGVVKGVIDAPNGVIFKASKSQWRRRANVIAIVAAALAGFALIWLACELGNWVKNWPLQTSQLTDLSVGYVFLLFGAIGHVVVDALKQSRRQKNRSFIAVEDWLLWLHVRESSLLWGIVYLWVGFGFVTASLRTISWTTAFFTGYSIDSVIDLFLDRFEKFAGEKTSQFNSATSVDVESVAEAVRVRATID
jgi:hypothetical protein